MEDGRAKSRHEGPIAPNRLAERTAPPARPDPVWAVDMTCLETTEGWLFLAVVLDLHSRKGVGWAFAESLPTSLPTGRPAHGLAPAPSASRSAPSQ
jgi:putative transposase